jgi:hypothetical protein
MRLTKEWYKFFHRTLRRVPGSEFQIQELTGLDFTKFRPLNTEVK